MAQLGYGYGSEFHLLRWMGRHREALNGKVQELIGLKGIEWLDFDFDKGKDIPDKELKGLSFLSNDARGEDVIKDFKDQNCERSWPQRGELMNWDAVGRTGDTYILCEAKAHVGEIEEEHDPGASRTTCLRERAFKFAKNKVGALPEADWMHNFYQMANRLYILALLHEHDIKAILLNIYFCGDKFRGRKCPDKPDEWREIIDKEYEKLGISDAMKQQDSFVGKYVKELFLPVDAENI